MTGPVPADVDLPWVRSADAAMDFAVADDMPGAARIITTMMDAHGKDTLQLAMLRWIDTAIRAAGWTPAATNEAVTLMFTREGSNEITTDPDNVRPTALWASRMIAARVADDFDTYAALTRSVPRDPTSVGSHVLELLSCAALAVAWHSRIERTTV